MTSWHSYPKVWNLGHAALKDLLEGPVVVEEKIDGSQFSFGIFGEELKCRSKGQQLIIDAPEKMFIKAIETVKNIAPKLKEGWTYRAEYLSKPKHNSLAYDRHPNQHLIIFDISPGEEHYLSYDEKVTEATRLELEVVPAMYQGELKDLNTLIQLLDTVSILGGQNIEGVVVKNYAQFGPDKKALMGKHVSEAFKEVHGKEWKKANPGKGDVLIILGDRYRSEARWNKAVQHIKEAGQLTNSPKDIGSLIKEAQRDITEECVDEIKEALYKWAMPKIIRIAIRGLPEWYKKKLMESQFTE